MQFSARAKRTQDPFLEIQATQHKQFFEELAKKLNIKAKEDWYKYFMFQSHNSFNKCKT